MMASIVRSSSSICACIWLKKPVKRYELKLRFSYVSSWKRLHAERRSCFLNRTKRNCTCDGNFFFMLHIVQILITIKNVFVNFASWFIHTSYKPFLSVVPLSISPYRKFSFYTLWWKEHWAHHFRKTYFVTVVLR